MNRVIGVISVLVILFYYIYPQALSLFGYSFLFTTGLIGLGLFLYHNSPFQEVIRIGLAYLPIILLALLSAYMNNNYNDQFVWNLFKTQFAYIFSSYLIIFIFFHAHPNGSVKLLMYYVVGVAVLQGIISIAMHLNPQVYDFFDSIQTLDYMAAARRAETRGTRLLGYGTAFFGAGIVYSAALVLLAYMIVAEKRSAFQTILFTLLYAFVFFVGILSARTTLIGMGVSLLLMIAILVMKREKHTKQFFIFFLLTLVSITILQTIAYSYFPEFANWAFEAFINYSETGELRTDSSDSLSHMFVFPDDLQTWIFGKATMEFWGTDVGYSRLLFYFGLPGLIMYFFYSGVLVKYAFTKNVALNLTYIALLVLSIVLNYKGLTDLNAFHCLFAFYFLYYKYYIYTPKMYMLKKQSLSSQNK